MPDFISNTSCLILLSKIQKLHLLKDIYGSIIITNTVHDEFGEELPDFFILKNVSENSNLIRLSKLLDPGEASTIALGLEKKESTLILDDYKARNIAKKLDLKFTGTLGILHKASKSGLLPDLKSEIIKLKENGFWISDEIINSLT